MRFLTLASAAGASPVDVDVTPLVSPSRFPRTLPLCGVCGGVDNGILDEDEYAIKLGTGASVGVKFVAPWFNDEILSTEDADGVREGEG